ncbi:MAG: tryptophan synthase subunit alpha [Cyclobacteriaceae bacterium]|nr:tryptophan synthase subunit alpha [Cyclobacteriaceae bacterium]
MKNRITDLLSNARKPVLSVFYTAGFPGLEDTESIAVALEEAGADMIEIGIPFSDPVADGPTIQASNKQALDNGMTVVLLLKQVAAIRKKIELPIILMGYLNPVMQYGFEKFFQDAARAGVDGLILPDLPLDEFEQYRGLTDSLNLGVSFLISPTTSEERIKKIDSLSTGFIYAVSASSTTGAKGEFTDEQLTYFKRLKSYKLKNPFLIGFGISNYTTYAQACAYGAGVIVGSSFIQQLSKSDDRDADIRTFVNALTNP